MALAVLVAACSGGDSATTAPPQAETSASAATAVPTSAGPDAACHPTVARADCSIVVVLLDDPIDLAGAEQFAAQHSAYLNALYRVDPVCVTKDFPMMLGTDLGETASRRVYWEADARLDRITADRNAGLVPPATMGGFDVVIDQRIRDEWRLAQEPGVSFDALALWIGDAEARSLEGAFIVELPIKGTDYWRYDHTAAQGEITMNRNYEPPPLLPTQDPGCVALDG